MSRIRISKSSMSWQKFSRVTGLFAWAVLAAPWQSLSPQRPRSLCAASGRNAEGFSWRVLKAARCCWQDSSIKLNWNEDWEFAGFAKVWGGFASRSLSWKTYWALKKLESWRSAGVCVGVWGYSGKRLYRYLQKQSHTASRLRLPLVVVNELMDRARFPEMFVLRSPFRVAKFKTYEEGCRCWRKLSSRVWLLNRKRPWRLTAGIIWKHHELERRRRGKCRGGCPGRKRFWQLDHSDMSTMTFIRWEHVGKNGQNYIENLCIE